MPAQHITTVNVKFSNRKLKVNNIAVNFVKNILYVANIITASAVHHTNTTTLEIHTCCLVYGTILVLQLC